MQKAFGDWFKKKDGEKRKPENQAFFIGILNAKKRQHRLAFGRMIWRWIPTVLNLPFQQQNKCRILLCANLDMKKGDCTISNIRRLTF